MSHSFVAAAKEFEFPPNVCLPERGNVADISANGVIFVSPANSLGFMDGGIDNIYRQMFPGCEQTVRHLIAELGHLTQLGRPYLRVGSACWQTVHNERSALISAPTMFLPHDVSKTRNAYWATIAALCAAEKIRQKYSFHTLVIPSLCCGWGRMSEADSLQQILQGVQDWMSGAIPAEVDDRGDAYVLLPSHDTEQPSNFDNREIGVAWPASFN